MSSEVKSDECERVRKVAGPALHHLIRLESYFRLHEIDKVSAHLEAALMEIERLTVVVDPPVGGTGDAPSEADRGPRLYTTG